MKFSSNDAILAGVRDVGDNVTFCDPAPSPMAVCAVTQNSYLKMHNIRIKILVLMEVWNYDWILPYNEKVSIIYFMINIFVL